MTWIPPTPPEWKDGDILAARSLYQAEQFMLFQPRNPTTNAFGISSWQKDSLTATLGDKNGTLLLKAKNIQGRMLEGYPVWLPNEGLTGEFNDLGNMFTVGIKIHTEAISVASVPRFSLVAQTKSEKAEIEPFVLSLGTYQWKEEKLQRVAFPMMQYAAVMASEADWLQWTKPLSETLQTITNTQRDFAAKGAWQRFAFQWPLLPIPVLFLEALTLIGPSTYTLDTKTFENYNKLHSDYQEAPHRLIEIVKELLETQKPPQQPLQFGIERVGQTSWRATFNRDLNIHDKLSLQFLHDPIAIDANALRKITIASGLENGPGIAYRHTRIDEEQQQIEFKIQQTSNRFILYGIPNQMVLTTDNILFRI